MDRYSTSLHGLSMLTFIMFSLCVSRTECMDNKEESGGGWQETIGRYARVLASAGSLSLKQVFGYSKKESTAIVNLNQIFQVACNQDRGDKNIIKNVYWVYKKYDDYGCHCGREGVGASVDESDSCCEGHTTCYDEIRGKWNITSPKQAYKTKYSTLCDIESGKSSCPKNVVNKGAALDFCFCDKDLAECLANLFAVESYDSENRDDSDKSKCSMSK